MSVEVQAPPQLPETMPGDEDRVHSGLFWLAIVAVVIGALVAGTSRVWASKAADLVTFPVTFDQTSVLSGTATLHVDPTTYVPLQTAQEKPYQDTRRVQTPGLLEYRALLVSTDAISIGGAKPATVSAQYLVDTRTLANLRSPQAWSFSGENVADRSDAYSVNLPFDTGPGPYQVWRNEADRAYAFTQVGQPFDHDGITVIRLHGHLDAAPVDPLYVKQIGPAGIPAALSLHELQPALAAMGLSVDASFPDMPATFSPTDVGAVTDPIPLDYTMTADTSLLVEPRTGTIVAVEKSDETFTAHYDAARLGTLATLLAVHRNDRGVPAMLAALAKLSSAGETPVVDLSYAQTAASMKTQSNWAATQRDWANRMTRVIPMTLLVTGGAVIALGILAGAVAWRRRNTVYGGWWEDE